MPRYTLSFDLESAADPTDILDELLAVAQQLPQMLDRTSTALNLELIEETCTVEECDKAR